MCTALCTIVAHNILQNRPDNFPSYPPDNHHCSDDVYLREGVSANAVVTSAIIACNFAAILAEVAKIIVQLF